MYMHFSPHFRCMIFRRLYNLHENLWRKVNNRETRIWWNCDDCERIFWITLHLPPSVPPLLRLQHLCNRQLETEQIALIKPAFARYIDHRYNASVYFFFFFEFSHSTASFPTEKNRNFPVSLCNSPNNPGTRNPNLLHVFRAAN